MEIQLQELIDQIKKDGVEKAESEALSIVTSAKEEADKIIKDAQEQAEKILQNAKSETERVVKSGEEAIRQAGRNLLISFRESVGKELTAIVGEGVNAVYSSAALEDMIITAVKNWSNKPNVDDLTVILNEEDLKNMEDTLLSALKDRVMNGVTLKANDNFDGGFRIAVNDGQAYYDYSAEAVVDMLSSYLSPKVTALLKEVD